MTDNAYLSEKGVLFKKVDCREHTFRAFGNDAVCARGKGVAVRLNRFIRCINPNGHKSVLQVNYLFVCSVTSKENDFCVVAVCLVTKPD